MNIDLLPKMPGLEPKLIPPRGAVPIGNLGDKVLYTMEKLDVKATKASKRPAKDPMTGEDLWELHPTTGQKMYPRFVVKPVFRTIQFTLRASPRGHVRIDEYTPPTDEEIRADQIAAKRKEILDRFVERAAEQDGTVDDLLNRMFGGMTAADAEDEVFPHLIGKSKNIWMLSDGNRFQGNAAAAHNAESKLSRPSMEEEDQPADEMEF